MSLPFMRCDVYQDLNVTNQSTGKTSSVIRIWINCPSWHEQQLHVCCEVSCIKPHYTVHCRMKVWLLQFFFFPSIVKPQFHVFMSTTWPGSDLCSSLHITHSLTRNFTYIHCLCKRRFNKRIMASSFVALVDNQHRCCRLLLNTL